MWRGKFRYPNPFFLLPSIFRNFTTINQLSTEQRRMAKLILSPANSALLRRLAEEGSGTNQDAIQALKMALNAQQPKMTVDSPAIPATDKDAQQAVVLDHTLLIKVAAWAQDDANVGASEEDVMKLKLSSLVVGSQVYVPPKPVFQRVSSRLVPSSYITMLPYRSANSAPFKFSFYWFVMFTVQRARRLPSSHSSSTGRGRIPTHLHPHHLFLCRVQDPLFLRQHLWYRRDSPSLTTLLFTFFFVLQQNFG